MREQHRDACMASQQRSSFAARSAGWSLLRGLRGLQYLLRRRRAAAARSCRLGRCQPRPHCLPRLCVLCRQPWQRIQQVKWCNLPEKKCAGGGGGGTQPTQVGRGTPGARSATDAAAHQEACTGHAWLHCSGVQQRQAGRQRHSVRGEGAQPTCEKPSCHEICTA